MNTEPNAVELTVDHAWFIAETIGAGSFPWVLAITTPYSDAAHREAFMESQKAELIRIGVLSADGVVTVSVAQLSYLLSGIDWRMPREVWRPQVAG